MSEVVMMDSVRSTDPNFEAKWSESAWTTAFEEFKCHFELVCVELHEKEDWTAESFESLKFLLKAGGRLVVPAVVASHVHSLLKASGEFSDIQDVKGDTGHKAFQYKPEGESDDDDE